MPKKFKRNGFVTLEKLVVFMNISYCLSALFWMMFTVLLDLRLWAAQSTVDVLVNKVLLYIQAHILIFSWIVP